MIGRARACADTIAAGIVVHLLCPKTLPFGSSILDVAKLRVCDGVEVHRRQAEDLERYKLVVPAKK